MSTRRRPKTAAPKSGAPKSGARTPAAKRRRPRPARDFWGTEQPDDRERAPIRPSDDPTALVHSLGPPPLPNGAAAHYYFDAVYERAATIAMALATSAGLTEPGEPG